MIENYSVQDLLGGFVAASLFFLLLIPPGYILSHVLDLFEFKSRLHIVKLGIGFLVSCAITPVFYFVVYRIFSERMVISFICIFVLLFIIIAIKGKLLLGLKEEIKDSRQIKTIITIFSAWMLLALISLIDIQIGDRLYFNITSYDYQTRVSVIDAITRTGVPPANPSFHPGGSSKLTFLYYFWYVLCSLVDDMGGNLVSARTALIGSVIWAGFAAMGTIAFYLRMRDSAQSMSQWKIAIIGISLLAVSGLDIFGSTFYMMFPEYLYGYFIDGDIEHWNEQITAWTGTTMWSPHHLVAMLNCIIGWLLVICHEKAGSTRKFLTAALAGLAFASAFGLSAWVTLIFIMFWLYLIISRLLKGERIAVIWNLFLPGIVAALSMLPFILDLMGNGVNGGGTSIQALTLDVRWFRPVITFIINTPSWLASTINLLFLPLNYFLELGFFFLTGILRLRLSWKNRLEKTSLWKDELFLLGISAIITSFTRSTLIGNNDFGWRGWLPGQFVLLIWGTDILSYYWKDPHIKWNLSSESDKRRKRLKYAILLLLAIGILTTIQDVTLLRTWPILVDTKMAFLPESIRSDEYLGTKNYEARKIFSKIEEISSPDTIVQFNPAVGLNRVTGLYRTRGAVMSFHTLYGIPEELYKPLGIELAGIFQKTYANWNELDTFCLQNKINILIITNTDVLWESVSKLSQLRHPIYKGSYYAAFECGQHN